MLEFCLLQIIRSKQRASTSKHFPMPDVNGFKKISNECEYECFSIKKYIKFRMNECYIHFGIHECIRIKSAFTDLNELLFINYWSFILELIALINFISKQIHRYYFSESLVDIVRFSRKK